MIIVKLQGGLGNQMFQYAAGRRLALLHNTHLKLDISHLKGEDCCSPRDYELKHLSIDAEIASYNEINLFRRHDGDILRRLFFVNLLPLSRKRPLRSFYREPHFHFDQNFFSVPDNCYIDGYWQSEQYFCDISDIIRSEFKVRYQLEKKNKEIENIINDSESVSLHVRRGDYISNPTTSNYHGSCGLGYYELIIEYLTEKLAQPRFFIFSDDPEWAKANLTISSPTTFISHNGSCPYEDLRLMSLCQHNIIANSSFSWWGAWLNSNPGKVVVAPSRWFKNAEVDIKDLLPKSWLKVSE